MGYFCFAVQGETNPKSLAQALKIMQNPIELVILIYMQNFGIVSMYKQVDYQFDIALTSFQYSVQRMSYT